MILSPSSLTSPPVSNTTADKSKAAPTKAASYCGWRVGFGRLSFGKVGSGQGANHSDVNSEAFAAGPDRQGDISWAAEVGVGVAENAGFLQHGVEQGLRGYLEDPVSHRVMAGDHIA